MRIAFLTSEYPSELPDAGGLATYVHRMAQLLREFGHEPEVFVTSRSESAAICYEGVTVHRIGWNYQPRLLRIGHRASKQLIPSLTWNSSNELLLRSYALSRSLEHRHASMPFDLVQSADYEAVGLLVRHRSKRIHAIRCSSAADLYNNFDQAFSGIDTVRGYLERLAMRRADIVYAPSRYVADHFGRTHKIKIQVIRPPLHINNLKPQALPFKLPIRFFIHFGMLIDRKGTSLLAEALPLAWKIAPDLTMVWSGKCWDQSKLDRWRSLWGDRATQVQITGALPRSQLYAVLQRADAAVLPSQVDNLPNTVIESLSMGVPVLGSRGASIDELVEDGKTGYLVELGDVQALADALARMWLGRSFPSKGFRWESTIGEEMDPAVAVANFLTLCRPSVSYVR